MSENDGKNRSLEGRIEEAEAALKTGEAKFSTSSLGRFAKLSGLMARTGSAAAGDKLRRLLGADGDVTSLLRSEAAHRLAAGLGEMKGLAMKIGQMMSYVDPSLPPEYRRILALLQTQSQPTPAPEVRNIVETELASPLERVFSDFEEAPIACASIGQVHRARLRDGTDVAVKVQHPEIEAAIRADLKSASIVGKMKALALPGQDIAGLGRELEARFLEECDYRLEAERQGWFADAFRGDDVIVVPEVHRDLSTRRVLVSTFEPGLRFENFLARNPPDDLRDRFGEALFRFYLGTLYERGVFHADPHPGNYLFREDGRLVMLDYGCVRRFEPDWLARMKGLLAAVMRDADGETIHEACVKLGIVHPTKRYDRREVREFLDYMYAPGLREGRHRITPAYAAEAIKRIGNPKNARSMRLPGEMLFLTRVNIGLMSIFADLGAAIDWRGLTLDLLAKDLPPRPAPS